MLYSGGEGMDSLIGGSAGDELYTVMTVTIRCGVVPGMIRYGVVK